jgi:hypothetical protein
VQDCLAGELAIDKLAGERADLAPWSFDSLHPPPERVDTQLARERLLALHTLLSRYAAIVRAIPPRQSWPASTLERIPPICSTRSGPQSRSTFGIRQLYRHPADRRLRLGPFRNYPAARPPVAA